MLKKLIKYDFKKTGAVMAPICGITILMGIVCGILLYFYKDSQIAGIEFFGLMILFAFAPLYMITQYFYKSLYTNEGYLTFTLPASNEVIVSAKIMVVCIWAVIFVASVFISLTTLSLESIMHLFKEGINPTAALEILYILFVLFLMGLSGVMALIFSVCIGRFWSKHNTFGTVLCFFVLGITLMTVYTKNMFASTSRRGDIFWEYSDIFSIENLVCSIVFIAVFFIATVKITSKKLNLD